MFSYITDYTRREYSPGLSAHALRIALDERKAAHAHERGRRERGRKMVQERSSQELRQPLREIEADTNGGTSEDGESGKMELLEKLRRGFVVCLMCILALSIGAAQSLIGCIYPLEVRYAEATTLTVREASRV